MLDACSEGGLRQVEVNTIAAGMGGLGTYVAEYARYEEIHSYCLPRRWELIKFEIRK